MDDVEEKVEGGEDVSEEEVAVESEEAAEEAVEGTEGE